MPKAPSEVVSDNALEAPAKGKQYAAPTLCGASQGRRVTGELVHASTLDRLTLFLAFLCGRKGRGGLHRNAYAARR